MITIVVPSFNEARNVAHVIDQIAEAFADVSDKRVIIVDDGSVDDTVEVAKALGAKHDFVECVSHVRNLGLGAALKTGYGRVSTGPVSWLPADAQFDAAAVRAFYDTQIKTGCAIVVGNITASARLASDNLFRLALSKALRVLFFLRKKRPINFNGLMLFMREKLPLDDMKSTTGLINFEILEHFERAGGGIEFQEISVHPRLSGKSKVTNLRTYLAVLKDMLLR